MPCKISSFGGPGHHLNAAGVSGDNRLRAYDDQQHHRPLVMLHNNMEVSDNIDSNRHGINFSKRVETPFWSLGICMSEVHCSFVIYFALKTWFNSESPKLSYIITEQSVYRHSEFSIVCLQSHKHSNRLAVNVYDFKLLACCLNQLLSNKFVLK